jgi:hypothetical protein
MTTKITLALAPDPGAFLRSALSVPSVDLSNCLSSCAAMSRRSRSC